MRLKAYPKNFKLLSIFLILLLIMFAFSGIAEGDSINEPVWAFPGAYVKYLEKMNSVTVYEYEPKNVSSQTNIGLYEIKILSVDLKNQTFSYLESSRVLYSSGPNQSGNNYYHNSTFNYTFSEYFNKSLNLKQPITIFFINKKTIDELNKGFVPGDLLSLLSGGMYSSLPGNSAKVTDNLTLNINNKIYPVIKIHVNYYNNSTLNYYNISIQSTTLIGNVTVYIDKYSGVIVEWNSNLIAIGPLNVEYDYFNNSIILNSTNIPMGTTGQINYYFVFALSIGVILIISITFIYFKKKNK